MTRYRLYGLTVATELRFAHRVPEAEPGAGPPDLSLVVVDAPALPGEEEAGPPLYSSPERRPDGTPVLEVAEAPAGTLLRYAGDAVLLVGEDRILARADPPAASGTAPAGFLPPRVEVRLLGAALAFHLERREVPVLHAAAVTIGDRAVAVLATQGGGKSSLAAALLTAGHPLLADDVLAVDVPSAGAPVARPAYPQMRFVPQDAARWLGAERSARLPRSHPDHPKLRVPVGGDEGLGRFDPSGRPLAGIYLPARRAPDDPRGVTIEPVTPRAAVLALLAGSFLPRLVEAMGWAGRRLDLLTRLASAVPVRRISFPEGLEHLPEVVERLAEDALQG
jgi:hypothetical protein